MILEIFLLGLLVFILGPIIYVCTVTLLDHIAVVFTDYTFQIAWSLILLCLGRHPLQNPYYIKPEIGKLPKSVVDQIPLVLYIPAPPEDSAYYSPPPKGSPASIPQPIYPPKSPSGSTTNSGSVMTIPRKKRFAFLRRKEKSKDGVKSSGKTKGNQKGKGGHSAEKTWEDHWEAGEYPFVRLEGHRAACAICLMDFEEPQRVPGVELPTSNTGKQNPENDKPPAPRESAAIADTDVEEVQVDEITIEDRAQLQLEDAGEGAQPLRLLACGHVFHVSRSALVYFSLPRPSL